MHKKARVLGNNRAELRLILGWIRLVLAENVGSIALSDSEHHCPISNTLNRLSAARGAIASLLMPVW
jgi:hypothetical protein